MAAAFDADQSLYNSRQTVSSLDLINSYRVANAVTKNKVGHSGNGKRRPPSDFEKHREAELVRHHQPSRDRRQAAKLFLLLVLAAPCIPF
jgi:hypothetical protein